jgi:membrane fusion protein, multidrug efflux system
VLESKDGRSVGMDQNTTIEQSVTSPFKQTNAINQRTINGSRRRSKWLWLLLGVAVVAIAAFHWTVQQASSKPAPKASLVPVSATTVKPGDLSVYLSEIGTVTPFATVTVKSRVSGNITKIDFKEGQIVDAGQLLLNIDPSPYEAQLKQYEGQLARDKATLANAYITFQRYKDLFREGVIARQDLDNQQALYNQALGTVQNDQGMIEGVKVNLSYCRVESPIRGRIGLRLVDLGNYVQPSNSLVVVAQLQPISVIFSIPEDNIDEVVTDMHNGNKVPVEAWNRDFSKRIETGSLLTYDNEIDENTGTVKLRAQFGNPDYLLFPNEFVNARLLLHTVQNAILVPSAAVQKSSQGSFVYVVQGGNTVVQRQVTVGATQGDSVAVVKGLSGGEQVVTDGLDRLQPGTKVSVRTDSNRAGATVGG